MRSPRILGEPSAAANYYHLMSRAIEGNFCFDEVAKEHFRELLEAHSEMAGIEIFTWCCMSNHFHLLAEVPNAEQGRASLDDEEILRRLGLVMSKPRVREVRQRLTRLKEESPDGAYLEYREKLLARMYDVSVFMRELKQRFAQWHNRRVDRKGPLFDDRFKSVLVQDDERALWTMAAYIDWNPVRAGLVDDPKDYRWSGYGEAVAGKVQRRGGLLRVYGERSEDQEKWGECQAWYRALLFGKNGAQASEVIVGGDQEANRGEATASSATSKRARAQRWQLNIAEVARVRVRYLTESLAFGTREWVEGVFQRNRAKLKLKRKEGARVPKEKGLEDWRGLKDVRVTT